MSRNRSEQVVEILPRSVVERTADIVGPASAAARALRCADDGTHGPNPVFVRPLGQRDSIMVTAAENLKGD